MVPFGNINHQLFKENMMKEQHKNPVKKNMDKLHKPATHKDKKYLNKLGKTKHKPNLKDF